MSILVTGATGFIGSHLCERLLARGDDLTVLDNFNDFYEPAIKRANAAELRGARVIEGDIRDQALVARLFREGYFDAVVHLAAMAGVRPSLLDPLPRVVLVPGLGMFAAGKDRRAVTIVGDMYRHTIDVIGHASAFGRYVSLDARDAFDVEYWPLELYKLSQAPPEKELARRIALITGGASGIGRAAAVRLAAEGAHVVVADLDGAGARKVAEEVVACTGAGLCITGGCELERDTTVQLGIPRRPHHSHATGAGPLEDREPPHLDGSRHITEQRRLRACANHRLLHRIGNRRGPAQQLFGIRQVSRIGDRPNSFNC